MQVPYIRFFLFLKLLSKAGGSSAVARKGFKGSVRLLDPVVEDCTSRYTILRSLLEQKQSTPTGPLPKMQYPQFHGLWGV